MIRPVRILCFPLLVACAGLAAAGQASGPGSTAQQSVEKLGDGLFRIGTNRVNTSTREVTVAGTVNPDLSTLEFIANSQKGWRAYETVLTLHTDATTFNAALVLIGLDKSHASGIPAYHFDSKVVEGDKVEIWIECPGGECQRLPAERVLLDMTTNQPLTGGSWVYTGSSFLPDGRYRAELDAVLIGFVHDPATIIEYARGAGLGQYGSIVLNPNLGLAAGTMVNLTVKALPGR